MSEILCKKITLYPCGLFGFVFVIFWKIGFMTWTQMSVPGNKDGERDQNFNIV